MALPRTALTSLACTVGKLESFMPSAWKVAKFESYRVGESWRVGIVPPGLSAMLEGWRVIEFESWKVEKVRKLRKLGESRRDDSAMDNGGYISPR